jgi:serine/threonine protein phosphatase PrpC
MDDFAGLSHPGAREGDNQDAIAWDAERQLWFVADGMGGYQHGRDASLLVKETLLGAVGRLDLVAAVLKAHEAVQQAAAKLEGDQRMGSTVVCAQITGDDCRIVWVGDSRAYLWRDQALQRLTRDHSFVEALVETEPLSETQMRNHPNASVVLQTLGMGSPVPSDRSVHLHAGDWIILCSDGLPLELRDGEIAYILQSSSNPQQAAQTLLDAALAKGGRDNTSVIVVQHGIRPAGGLKARLTRLDSAVVGWIAALAGVLLAAVVVVIAWRLRAGR